MNNKKRLLKYTELIYKIRKGVKPTAKSTSHLINQQQNRENSMPQFYKCY